MTIPRVSRFLKASRLLLGAGAVLVCLALPVRASASTIAANCGTCGSHNTSFNISYSLLNDAQNIYQFVVTATYGSPVDFTYINAISFKLDAYNDSSDYENGTPTVVGPAED